MTMLLTYFSALSKASQLTFQFNFQYVILASVLDTMNEVFQALFYGSGSWLGILLLLSICLGLVLKWKYSGVLLLPITVFLGIDYLNQSLVWHALIMWFSTIFILIYMTKKKG